VLLILSEMENCSLLVPLVVQIVTENTA